MPFLQGCIPEAPNVNNLFVDCCCQVTCVLEKSPGEPNRQIDSIYFQAPVNAQIISINGVPYTGPTDPPLPLNLAATQPVTLVLEFCGGINPLDSFSEQLVVTWTSQGGGAIAFNFDFLTLQPSNYLTPIAPQTLDFGLVQVGNSATIQLQVENPTICSQTYDWSFVGANCADLSVNQPTPFIVPPNTSVPLEITFAPNSPLTVNCEIDVTVCGGKPAGNRFIVGASIIGSSCVNCQEIRLLTENSYLPTSPDLCGGLFDVYTSGAIGEKKIFELTYSYTFGLPDGLEIWFNPYLYGDICDFVQFYAAGQIDQPPPVAFYAVWNNSALVQQMQIVGAGASANSQKNYSASITKINATTFKITFEFYLVADRDSWLNGSLLFNNHKLLKNQNFAPVILQNNVQSVYNVEKRFCFLVYLRDPTRFELLPFARPFECYEIESVRTTLRFYNQGLFAGPSEMTNPIFTFERNGNPVGNFSTVFETIARFQVDFPDGIANVLFWLIDASNFDDSIDFYQNYDSSRAEITTIAGPGVLDNHLRTPSVGVTNIGGNTYQVEARVGTTINPGGQFYLIAVVYSLPDGNGDQYVNSFITKKPISATDVPGEEDCCSIQGLSVFQDYNAAFPIHFLKPTMKERLEHFMFFQAGNLEQCLIDWNAPAGVTWNQFVKRVRLNVYREEVDFPNIGETTFFFYGQYQSERIVGFPANFNNLTPPFSVEEFGTLIASKLPFRVRWENNLVPNNIQVANNATPFQRVPAGPSGPGYASTLGITYNWAGQEIIFEYIVELDLSSVFGSPFELCETFRAKIVPFDFEGTVFRNLDEIKCFEPNFENPNLVGPEISGPICSNSFNFIWIRVHKTLAGAHSLIAFLELLPSALANLQEEESYFSTAPFPLVPLDSPSMFQVDDLFDGPTGFAYFKIDLNTLPAGKYELCGLAKFVPDPGSIIPIP